MLISPYGKAELELIHYIQFSFFTKNSTTTLLPSSVNFIKRLNYATIKKGKPNFLLCSTYQAHSEFHGWWHHRHLSSLADTQAWNRPMASLSNTWLPRLPPLYEWRLFWWRGRNRMNERGKKMGCKKWGNGGRMMRVVERRKWGREGIKLGGDESHLWPRSLRSTFHSGHALLGACVCVVVCASGHSAYSQSDIL